MSYRHLTLEERYQIQALRCHATQAEIARVLGRSPSTISRELSRNVGTFLLPYSAKQASFKARTRRIEKGKSERKIQGELESLVDQKLRLGWSPEQLCGRLRKELGISLSHETVYQYIIRDNDLPFAQSKRLRYCLRWHGYKQHRFKKSRMAQRTALRKLVIDQRPAAANNRTELGHWERDLLLGQRGKSAVLTIIDRKSRYLLVEHVERVDCDAVATATIRALKPHRHLTKTMTNDNGVEFGRDEQLQKALKIPIFFTHPSSPWERGSIENANGLARQYLYKGADFDGLQKWAPLAVQHTLNFRPRKTLAWRTPHEVFYKEKIKLMTGPLLRFGLETGACQ